MRLLVRLLVLALLVAGAGELLLPGLGADRVAARAAEGFPQASEVDAEVGDFPITPGLASTAPTVGRVQVRVADPATAAIPVEDMTLELHEVALDGSDLLSGDVTVTDVGEGRATARVRLAAVLEQAGASVGLDDVDPGAVELVDGHLQADVPGAGAARIAIPDVLPCQQRAELDEQHLEIGCALADPPAWIVGG